MRRRRRTARIHVHRCQGPGCGRRPMPQHLVCDRCFDRLPYGMRVIPADSAGLTIAEALRRWRRRAVNWLRGHPETAR